MADTIPGGAYLHTDGKTWLDAEGRPLPKERVAEAEALQAEKQQAVLEAEAALQQQETLARSALRQFLAGTPTVAPAAEGDDKPRRAAGKAKSKE